MRCTRPRFPDGTRHRTEEQSPTCPPASVPRHPELPEPSPAGSVPGRPRDRCTGFDRALPYPKQGGASWPIPPTRRADTAARRPPHSGCGSIPRIECRPLGTAFLASRTVSSSRSDHAAGHVVSTARVTLQGTSTVTGITDESRIRVLTTEGSRRWDASSGFHAWGHVSHWPRHASPPVRTSSSSHG